MAIERTQHDSMDLMGQPIRLVFEKESDDPNDKNYTSTLYYWPGDHVITMVFADGKIARGVYQGLKSARTKVEIEVPHAQVNISEG